MFMMPSRIRKAADTDVPIMPPTREKLSNLSDTAEAVPATTMEVTMTILRRMLKPWLFRREDGLASSGPEKRTCQL